MSAQQRRCREPSLATICTGFRVHVRLSPAPSAISLSARPQREDLPRILPLPVNPGYGRTASSAAAAISVAVVRVGSSASVLAAAVHGNADSGGSGGDDDDLKSLFVDAIHFYQRQRDRLKHTNNWYVS